ncbi:MAG: phosphatase PAP2 family protein [Rhodococcus sp. (in: high G+C Gram-positive bacteria)]
MIESSSLSTVVLGSLASALGYALALATLAVAVTGNGWLVSADAPITRWMVDHRAGALDDVARAVTTAGGPPEHAAICIVVAALMVWRTKRYLPAIVLLGTVAAATVLCTVLKLVVDRARPPLSVQLILETDPSFPSGHVTGTAALAAMMALVLTGNAPTTMRRLAALAVVVVTAIVAATRVYLGVHWLSDVCAGALTAALAVTLGMLALRLLEQRSTGTPSHRTTAHSVDHTISGAS